MTLRMRGAGALAAAIIAILSISTGAEAGKLRNDPSRPILPAAATPSDEAKASEGRKPEERKASRDGTSLEHLIARHASEAGVPVALAQAVVRIESNFNPRATGSAGEVGLMQIKPRTARGIGYTGSTSALYDPDINLRWGMKYLAGAYKLAGGDLCGTVMRYQGGHYASRMTKANTVYCGKARQIMAQAGIEFASL